MITMLVMAFGLLALAYMETWGFRHNQDAESRTQASMIAGELIERIRDSGIAPTAAQASAYTASPSGEIACTHTVSSPENSRNCFFLQLRQRLPSAAATVSAVTAAAPPVYQVTVAWVDRYSDPAGSDTAPTIADCLANDRLASADSSNGLVWYPAAARPTENVCLSYARWWMTP